MTDDDADYDFFFSLSIPDPHVFLATLSTELECCLLNAQSWNMIKHALVAESTDRVMIDVKREYGTEN